MAAVSCGTRPSCCTKLVRGRLTSHHPGVHTVAEKGGSGRSSTRGFPVDPSSLPDGVELARSRCSPPSGLFSSAVAGIYLEDLLAGAAYADERVRRVGAASPTRRCALARGSRLFPSPDHTPTPPPKPILVLFPWRTAKRLSGDPAAGFRPALGGSLCEKAHDLTRSHRSSGPYPRFRRAPRRRRSALAAYPALHEGARQRCISSSPRCRDHGPRRGGLADDHTMDLEGRRAIVGGHLRLGEPASTPSSRAT